MSRRGTLARFLAAVVLAYTARTGLLMVLAWDALRAAGGPAGPALIFAGWALTELLAAPLLGVVIDRVSPQRALALSEAGASLILLVFAGLRQLELATSLPALLCASIAVSFVGAGMNPSIHGISRSFATKADATAVASRTASAGAVGFIVGYGFGGLLLKYWSLSATLTACALSSLAVVLIAPRSTPTSLVVPARSPEPPRLLAGLRLFEDAALKDAALGFMLCYAVFHSVSVLLPSFSKFALAMEVDGFGALRALWSLGALGGSLLLTFSIGRRELSTAQRYALITTLGASLVAFACCRTDSLARLTVTLTGALFAVTRSVLDGLVFRLAPEGAIGRVRGNINSLICATSLLVSVPSTALAKEHVAVALGLVGGVVTVAGVVLFWRRVWLAPAPQVSTAVSNGD